MKKKFVITLSEGHQKAVLAYCLNFPRRKKDKGLERTICQLEGVLLYSLLFISLKPIIVVYHLPI